VNAIFILLVIAEFAFAAVLMVKIWKQ